MLGAPSTLGTRPNINAQLRSQLQSFLSNIIPFKGGGASRVSSPLTSPKLADSYYDPDSLDRSPPLEPFRVNLRPTPPPVYFITPNEPSPESAGPSHVNGGHKSRERMKVLPSLGDTVLLDYMGSQNRPDIAKAAYEQPLQDDSDEEMVVREVGGAAVENDLVQTAQDAARIIDETDRNSEDAVVDLHGHRSPIDLPVCTTQDLNSVEEHGRKPEVITVKEEGDTGSDTIVLASKAPTTAVDKTQNKTSSPKTRRPSSSRGSIPKGRRNSDSLASSPVFRHAISVSQGSPMDSETLPAMKTSPQQNTTKSPNGQQSLPSLHDQLGPLAEFSPVKGEAANGTSSSGRGTFVAINGHSPPKTAQYPNLQTRTYHHPYPPTAPQPSPSSTSYSSNSPRDFRSGHDPIGLSHAGKPGSAYYNNGTTPQSDEQGPLSAESNPTTGSYSTDASPNGDRMSIDTPRPITLPPLPAGGPLPLANGGCKCEFTGCTAAPFQTQYLLK